jgi:hypothetical protein
MGVILILDGVPQRVGFGDDERNGTYPLFPSPFFCCNEEEITGAFRQWENDLRPFSFVVWTAGSVMEVVKVYRAGTGGVNL